MSCLIQALLPTIVYNSDKESHTSADKHGGFEMGTWDYPVYFKLFELVIGKHDWYSQHREVEDGRELGCIFNFTEEQCDKIAAFLVNMKSEESKHGNGFNYGIHPLCGNPYRVKVKWHNRMVAMFAQGPVTYYAI
jgi:hypothetical protein